MGKKMQEKPKLPETVEEFMDRIESELDAIGGKLNEGLEAIRDASAMLTDLDLMRGNFHAMLRGQEKERLKKRLKDGS